MSRDGQPLNIDVVFVNILNGEEIAQVFKKLGVPQVFTFNSEDKNDGEMSSVNTFKYHSIEQALFMKDFSNGMISRLGQYQSFYRAKEELIKNKLSKSHDLKMIS